MLPVILWMRGDGSLHNNVFTPVNTNNDMIVVGKAGLFNDAGSYSDIYASNGNDTIIMQNVFLSGRPIHFA